MAIVSYEKLRVLMVQRRLQFKDLRVIFGFSPKTIKKLREDKSVNLSILLELCSFFECDIGDIMQVKIVKL